MLPIMTELKTASSKISYVSVLTCSGCGKTFSIHEIHTYCPDCQSPILVNYDLAEARRQVDRSEIHSRLKGMWRWHEILPVLDPQNMVSLGEGDTALLRLPHVGKTLGLENLFVKDESSNPTGSFKARGLSAAISKAKELGIKKVIIPTAGNAGGAMAAYAARADMQAMIYMPKDTPRANMEESRMAGAEVVLVDGLISDAAGMAGIKAREEGWFDLSTFKEPYRTEGKKIMGYELAEAFDWSLPDVILYPTGGGTGLVGMWKAFAELEELGWLKDTKRPRMVSTGASTIASGLRVPKSFADLIILHDLRESQGTAVAVSDDELLASQHELGRAEGIFAAPEGAATLAALKKLVQEKWVDPQERIVLFNTGSGLKYIG
jgi:threonine synthase